MFAYKLAGNSLDSLKENLKEWEKSVSPSLWSNAVVILDEGIIYHTKGFKSCFENDEIENSDYVIGMHWKKDTLFYFYSILIQISSAMNLGSIQLENYFEQSEKLGSYIVKGHDRFCNKNDNFVRKLTENFIDKIVKHCKEKGKIIFHELLFKQFGEIPQGMQESELKQQVYLYNPDSLKGIHEIENPFEMVDGQYVAAEGLMIPLHSIVVNDEVFYCPAAYISEQDLEIIEGKTYDDL